MNASKAGRSALVGVVVALLGGCGTYESIRPTSRVEFLTPTEAFHLHVATFANADIPKGALIPVVGTVVRQGAAYRVVTLPDPAVNGFSITLDDTGRMVDSINGFNGARAAIGTPEPPDVRLVPRRPEVASAVPPPEPAPPPEPQDGPAPATDTFHWTDVPCDVVVADKRAACAAEHANAGIAENESAAEAGRTAPVAAETRTCPYANDGYRPIVDMQGVDPVQFECDLGECQTYAAQISPANNAIGGAVAGAIFGALFGLAVGDHGWAARAGAQGGAIGGAAAGLGGAAAARVQTVRNCIAGRGYRVLQ